VSIFADAVAEMWSEFDAAGFHVVATDGDGTFAVDFSKPDFDRMGRAVLSRDYEIEYRHADRPSLKEGDALTIDGESYRVRQAPYIAAPGNAADGTFRCALLTKV
jgi:hypothetical protein